MTQLSRRELPVRLLTQWRAIFPSIRRSVFSGQRFAAAGSNRFVQVGRRVAIITAFSHNPYAQPHTREQDRCSMAGSRFFQCVLLREALDPPGFDTSRSRWSAVRDVGRLDFDHSWSLADTGNGEW